jgi:hypothetical protein
MAKKDEAEAAPPWKMRIGVSLQGRMLWAELPGARALWNLVASGEGGMYSVRYNRLGTANRPLVVCKPYELTRSQIFHRSQRTRRSCSLSSASG